jgi:hypothetical protein
VAVEHFSDDREHRPGLALIGAFELMAQLHGAFVPLARFLLRPEFGHQAAQARHAIQDHQGRLLLQALQTNRFDIARDPWLERPRRGWVRFTEYAECLRDLGGGKRWAASENLVAAFRFKSILSRTDTF